MHAASLAGKEGDPDVFLEILDLPADRARRDGELARGFRHGLQAGDGMESAQSVERGQVIQLRLFNAEPLEPEAQVPLSGEAPAEERKTVACLGVQLARHIELAARDRYLRVPQPSRRGQPAPSAGRRDNERPRPAAGDRCSPEPVLSRSGHSSPMTASTAPANAAAASARLMTR